MGSLIAIACGAKRAPWTEMSETLVSTQTGLAGDPRGARRGRQVTVLFRDPWEAACADLGIQLPWVTRRANLLLEGVPTPRPGARLAVGDVILEVTGETKPCHWMEAAHRGLLQALKPDWRAGVTCNVVAGGTLRSGDAARALP